MNLVDYVSPTDSPTRTGNMRGRGESSSIPLILKVSLSYNKISAKDKCFLLLTATLYRLYSQSQQEMSEPIDESKLTPQELKLYKLYGKLPSRNDVLSSKLQERKFFDSGDYALKKAGVKKDINNTPIKVSDRHLTPGEILRINRNSVSSASPGINHGRSGSISGVKSGLENEVDNETEEK